MDRHYIALVECAKRNKKKSQVTKYFKLLSSPEKLMFFENHRDVFKVINDRYVTPTNLVLQRYRILNQQEAEIVQMFSSIMEHYREMSCVELIKRLKNSDLDSKNFFDYFSQRDIREFFQTHWPGLEITNNGGCYKVKAKKVFGEKDNSETTKSNFVYRAAELQNLKFHGVNCKSLVKEASVNLLISTLCQYGSMHYLAVVKCVGCKPNSSCLKKLSSSEKFAIFKYYPNFFIVEPDGFVTPTSFVLEKYKATKQKETIIVDYFISVLKTTHTIHYTKLVKLLQNSDLEVKDHFDSCSKFDIRMFFKSHPVFSIGEDNCVSLQGEAEIDTTKENDQCRSITVESLNAQSTQGNNTSNATKPFPRSIPCIGSDSGSEVKDSVVETVDRSASKDKEQCVACHHPSVDKYSVESGSVCFPTNQKLTPAEKLQIRNKPLKLSMLEAHMQSVRYLVLLLKKKKHAYYYELLYKACNHDRYTYEFFSYFTMAHVLEFIQMHSMYFFVQEGGIVSLVDPKITLNKVFVSKEHVYQITTIMEAKAVQFFVNLLLQRKRVALTELECHIGFAPGYVISFFVANYYGENFSKFFQHHLDYFHISTDGFVELSSKFFGTEVLNDVCASPLPTGLDKVEENLLVPNSLRCENEKHACDSKVRRKQSNSLESIKEQCIPVKRGLIRRCCIL